MLRFDGIDIRQDEFRLQADCVFGRGKVTALIGPSGAGKSTVLSVLAGFFDPVAGRVLWNGTEIQTLPPAERPVSILFQDNNLFPHMTLAENVGLALTPRRLKPSDREKVEEVLASVGLEGFGQRRPGEVSGGQQSRAALARALLADRPLVLLDEPFAALGPRLRGEMLDLVKTRLARPDRLVLMVTHGPEDARRIADEVALVAEGRLHAPVPTAEIFAAPPPALAAYLGDD